MTSSAAPDVRQEPPGTAAEKPRRASRWLPSQRIRAILILVIPSLLMFAGFRVGLLMAFGDSLGDASRWDLFQCFGVGAQFDGLSLGALALPLVLALTLAPAGAFPRLWFRRLAAGYVTIILAGVTFVEVTGAFFFAHFDTRLDLLAIAYLGSPETLTYVWQQYPVVWALLGVAALLAGVYWLVMRLAWADSAPCEPRWKQLVLSAGLVSLCVLGMRGGLDGMPLRAGSAYVSGNNVVNQLTMSNVFSLLDAIRTGYTDDNTGEEGMYPFPPPGQAMDQARQMLYQPRDESLADSRNPLWRRSVTGQALKDYNVVVIVMEGMSGQPVGALGNTPSYSPNVDALSQEGLFFDRMYAVGARTNRGLTGVLCGHPDLGGRSVLTQSRSQGRFLTLPGIMKARGYRTLFVYGGQPKWDNIGGFFAKGGVEEFIGQDQIASADSSNQWGVPDEDIFRKAHQRFLQYGDQRFFAAILTVSNHEPFIVPPGRVEMLPEDSLQNRKLNSYRYADWAIGEFFRQARLAPYFQKTIFVLVADHGRDLTPNRILDVPGLVPARRVSVVSSQTDIAPTVLSLLGGQFDHCFLGRNLLTVPEDDGFALLHAGDRLAFVRGDQALLMPPQSPATLVEVTNATQQPLAGQRADQASDLQAKMMSYYFTSRQLYLDSQYCGPEQSRPLGR